MKTISAAMQTHIAGEVTTLAWIWRVTRRDGTAFYFTSHDADLDFNSNTYKADTGFVPTALSNKGDMSVNNMDVSGPFGVLSSSEITEADMLNGLYDEAEFEVSMVNWTDPDTYGEIKQVKGVIGHITRKRGQFVAEVRSLTQYLQQQIGNVYSPSCRSKLGDQGSGAAGGCGVNLAAITDSGTVDGVTSRSVFTDTATGAIAGQANDYYDLGLLTWTSGDNDGLSMEVKAYGTGGNFQLVMPMPYDIQIGDTFDVYPGCDKSIATCKAKFNNVINFRGEPYVPGNNFLTNYPNSK